MRAMFLAPALLLSVMSFAPASAAPVAPLSAAAAVELPLIQAQYYHRDRYHAAPRHRAVPRYRAGHRYRSAPHGWHRYDRRPGNWSRRGCILVGPVWFCP